MRKSFYENSVFVYNAILSNYLLTTCINTNWCKILYLGQHYYAPANIRIKQLFLYQTYEYITDN